MGLEGRRLWSREEDRLLVKHIQIHGEGKWSQVSRLSGLNRNAKSCRFRWTSYLHPELNLSVFSSDEEDLILRMHKLIGNRWSLIAGRLPGRTALAVKNHWNTTLRKKILHHHCHVVKPQCTRAAGFSPSHHNEKTKGLSSDSFLKSEGQRHNSHDGPHIPHGIAEAETKSTINAEMKSQLHPLHDIDQGCMIPPDPGSLSATINNIMQQEEDNLSQQYNSASDYELICMAAGMPSIIEDEIHLWEVNAEEPFSLWQSSLYHI